MLVIELLHRMENEGAGCSMGVWQSKLRGIYRQVVDVDYINIDYTVAIGAVGMAVWRSVPYDAFDALSRV